LTCHQVEHIETGISLKMNGPLFGNTAGGGSGLGQIGDAQAVAAAKNVSLDR